MQSKLTYAKMTQNNTYFLLHGAPYKSNISSWQPPRYCSQFIFLQMETGCQLVPKMFSVTFLSGFSPQTISQSRYPKHCYLLHLSVDISHTAISKFPLSPRNFKYFGNSFYFLASLCFNSCYLKLMVSQSTFSAIRKFTFRY